MKKKGSGFRVQGSGFRQSRAGFTLIEIILYMSLLAVFLITLTDIFVSILDVSTESEATSSVEQDSRSMLSRFNLDIANADSITTPANLGETSNDLQLINNGTTYTYSLWGERIIVASGTETNAINSTGTEVSTLSFQRIGNVGGKETIRIRFNIQSATNRPSGVETRSFTTTVGRR